MVFFHMFPLFTSILRLCTKFFVLVSYLHLGQLVLEHVSQQASARRQELDDKPSISFRKKNCVHGFSYLNTLHRVSLHPL
jgi:hypothetical protein